MLYNTGYKDLSYHSVQADLNKLLEQYDNVGSKSLELTDVYDILGNVTDDYAEHMYELAKSGVDAATMLSNANQMIINNWAEENGEDLVTGQAQIMASK
ncbi:MAG: hypothetical protein NC218_07520 [Acetobacter sp.]|nr:hypothetical protein [Acetobacter sp.]